MSHVECSPCVMHFRETSISKYGKRKSGFSFDLNCLLYLFINFCDTVFITGQAMFMVEIEQKQSF